ncbi:MAG: NAD-dependent epimerase/dehydratase family protein [Gemmatimonadetes bacterium]|nr:NAD-dependent epimerase/dehydratase family protein [Gemmatimonadota bacterium]
MKSLVTGATGFLGAALARRLLERGDDVSLFQRGDSPELQAIGAIVHRGDLRDREAVRHATRGADVVFHGAAKVGTWGTPDDFDAINVRGTEHVVAACRVNGVRRLVFTSSASVVFGRDDLHGVNESAPYTEAALSDYARTKAQAERVALAACGGDLASVALRPHLVWGPGDPQLIGRLVQRVRQGSVRLVGDGQNLIDSTYIDNAVDAHILADERLAADTVCHGKPYFITNGEPLPLAQLVNSILEAGELPRVAGSVSPRVAYAVAAVAEAIHRLFRLEAEPPLTRFIVRELVASHWFDISAARRDLGYEPAVSIAVGLQRLRESFFPP